MLHRPLIRKPGPRFRSIALAVAVALTLLPGLGPAGARADEPTEPEPITLQQRPDRHIAELPNGLIVIAQRMTTAPVVSAQVWVKTGSIYEQQYVGAGISHFLEHLLSGGSTTTRTEAESNAILGRIGGAKNAATGLDNVRYYINTTSDHALTAVDLLSDWITNPSFPQNEFDRERDVIQSEFSMGEGDPNRIFWRLTQQARYNAHPARHPTIGYIDEFLEITPDDIRDFYNSLYVPNNMVFVVTGDIEPPEVVARVAENWKNVEPRELPELSFPIEPELEAPRELIGRADINRPRVRLAWPATRLGAEHDYALDLLGVVLGQGETARLTRTVRDQQRLVNTVSAYNASFAWGAGFFGIDVEVADFAVPVDDITETEGDWNQTEEQLATATLAIQEQIERLRDEPVSDAELARAKRNILARVLSANQTAEGVASRLASDVIATGDPDYLQRYARKIEKLTAEDLQAAAQHFLEHDRLITVKLLPATDEHPVESLRRTEDGSDPTGFPQEAVDLSNERIVAQMRDVLADAEHDAEPIEVGDYEVFTLDNGLRVIVQRSTVVPAVAMQMFWKGGLLGEKPGEEGVANAVASMMRRGTQNFTADELAEAVEDLGAQLSVASGNNTAYAQARALREDWPTVLELMAEVVRRPTFPEQEWERLQPRLLAAIDRQSDSWYGELSKHFRETYFGDHPWSQTPMGRREVVERLMEDDLRDYHAGWIGAEDAIVVVVGDVETDAVRQRVEALFGDLPREPERPFEPVAAEPPMGMTLHQIATAKPVTAVTMGFGPAIDRNHQDYAAIQVMSRVMSDFPSGWLQQALRGEGPGLAYASWTRLVTGLVPGYFELSFNTTAAQASQALDRAMRVVHRAREASIADDDLTRARAKVLTSEFFSRQSNEDRAMSAGLDELYGVGDPDGERFRRRVEAMTADDVRDVARQYLDHAVIIVMSRDPIDTAGLDEVLDGVEIVK